MKIKVCGLKHPENIAQVAALSPGYMGFIFYDRTPRFVASLPLDTLNTIPSNITKTAVFVNESAENISQIIAKYNFDAIQLHGAESPEFCLTMDFRPGDIQFLNNYAIIHTRTAFRDEPDPDKRRLLLRLWLNLYHGRALAPGFGDRFNNGSRGGVPAGKQ